VTAHAAGYESGAGSVDFIADSAAFERFQLPSGVSPSNSVAYSCDHYREPLWKSRGSVVVSGLRVPAPYQMGQTEIRKRESRCAPAELLDALFVG
jgi:hypothetical protein